MTLSAAALSTGAFCPHGDFEIAGAASGALKGLTFAVKDIFDIAGRVTGCGNPTWLKSHGPAPVHAAAVQRLLDAGARMVGKTITDELAFSLYGRNAHYGTPRNAATPDRIPGGSSCGSASAVGHGVVDLALGSDTGGSVRVPAALNGIYGFRPSHGRVDATGVMPLAPTFDTVGWFARDAGTLARVGDVLLPPDRADIAPARFLLARDAFALADPVIASAVRGACALPIADEIDIAVQPGGLAEWLRRFRRLQPREIWGVHGAWIETRKPVFGAELADRFAMAKQVAQSPEGDDQAFRAAVTTHLADLLGNDGALVIPTIGTVAPRLDDTDAVFVSFRDRTLTLCCIAGLARLPQVQVPAGTVEGAAIGLSVIGPAGSDRALLRLAARAVR